MLERESGSNSMVDGTGGADEASKDSNGSEGDTKKTDKPDFEAMYKGEQRSHAKTNVKLEAALQVQRTMNGLSDRMVAMQDTILNLDLGVASTRDEIAVGLRRSADDDSDDDDTSSDKDPGTSHLADTRTRQDGLTRDQAIAGYNEKINANVKRLDAMGEGTLTDASFELIKTTWEDVLKNRDDRKAARLSEAVANLVANAAVASLTKQSDGSAADDNSNDSSGGDGDDDGDADESNDDEKDGDKTKLSKREQIAGDGLGMAARSKGSTASVDDVKNKAIDDGPNADTMLVLEAAYKKQDEAAS